MRTVKDGHRIFYAIDAERVANHFPRAGQTPIDRSVVEAGERHSAVVVRAAAARSEQAGRAKAERQQLIREGRASLEAPGTPEAYALWLARWVPE